jgi:hypothetical protein
MKQKIGLVDEDLGITPHGTGTTKENVRTAQPAMGDQKEVHIKGTMYEKPSNVGNIVSDKK